MKTLTQIAEDRKMVQRPSLNKPGISDQAFYLIALIKLLKSDIYPASLEDYLRPGNFVGFRNKS